MTADQDWFGEDRATFGDRLAGAREAAGLSQAALAGKLGVKRTTVEAWEHDLKEPRANRLSMLAGVLGVSMSWLLTGTGDGPEQPVDGAELDQDVADLLADIRTVRGEISRSSETLGRLEKRLRALLKDAV